MSYINFDKSQLVNLEYSLSKEILRSNRAGSYSCSTIIGCNTRKYHGMLVIPLEQFGGERFLLISSLDETIIQHEKSFNVGIRKYKGGYYHPRGHKYVRDVQMETIPVTIVRVGGVVLQKERVLVGNAEQALVRYTLLDAHSPTTLQFRPFLAFRSIHELTHQNMAANTRVKQVQNGIESCMYEGFPSLYMQFSREVEYVHVPDWYTHIEYPEEQRRGYDCHEDQFVPGFFELPIEKGESIVFSASTREENPAGLKAKFNREISKRVPRDSFKNCLVNSAQQFLVKRGRKTDIIAGFPWFGSWGRDTFIALPGLTLSLGDAETCLSVLKTQVSKMQGGLFPNMGLDDKPAFNSVDAPMWFFWAVQKYVEHTGENIWKTFGKAFKAVLEAYRKGTTFNIGMQENGLIYAGEEGKALSWMDAVNHAGPVTPRTGYAVEINVLWYNALCFSLEQAEAAGDTAFVKAYADLPERVGQSFRETFWSDDQKYLADCVPDGLPDWAVRPNMVFATSVPYSPVTDEMAKRILDKIERELLTPRGLRTLSPMHPDYQGVYEGDQNQRDAQYHQGTVWPWLLGHFCEGYLKLHKRSGYQFVYDLIHGFEEVMMEHGIGSISEIYDGDPPHMPKGAISQAWSVAEILRSMKMLEEYE